MRNGDRLEIRSRIGPGNDNLLPAKVTALLFHDGHQVRQALEGMINVALHVQHRRPAGFCDIVQIFIPIPEIAMADRDAIEVTAKDFADFHRRIPVRNLRGV